MCTSADKQMEPINTIKKLILQKTSITGECPTAITGLKFLRNDGQPEKDSQFYKPSIVVIIQGAAWTIIKEKKYYCEEKDYFFTASPRENYNPINSSGERPFLALLFTLEEHIISQLVPHIAELSRAKNDGILQNVPISHIDGDLLNCFLRLVRLLDKPEQIHVRAPIIIREIHYLLLTSPLGEKLKTLSRHAIQTEKKFKHILHVKAPVLSVNHISSNRKGYASRYRLYVHYGTKI